MKLIFLGSGSAFTVGEGNYNSNILLHKDKAHNLLIDCGTDIRFSLFDQGFDYTHINDVYISHLHADHVGGLEWLAFSCHFNNPVLKPRLLISDLLVDDLWEHVLKGGLSSLQNEKANLNTYFNVEVFKNNQPFYWESIIFNPLQVLHTLEHNKITPCFGLFFTINVTKILFTADIQFYPALMMSYYEAADIIFHDCQTKKRKSSAHSQYYQLKTLPLKIKKKMWLYHYNPERKQQPHKDGFKGFVEKGQVFNF